MTIITRRSLLIGLTSFIAAPAIVRASSIMPVSAPFESDPWVSFQSWPIGAPSPYPCVSGQDLLSQARKICAWLGTPGNVYIRNQPLEIIQ